VILAIDTATRVVSLALADHRSVLAEHTWHTANNHTVEVAPAIEQILSGATVEVRQLTAIAVAIGPGSFTGVRIGLGLAKGLALAHDKPLIGVRTLDIIARGVPLFDGRLIAVIQAGRGRVIWATYLSGPQGWETAEAGSVGTWEEMAAQANDGDHVIGEIDQVGIDHLRRYRVEVGSPEQNVRRAAWLAEIGWERWRQGRVDDPATLAPIYARQPTSGNG